MKVKYEIYAEAGCDPHGDPAFRVVKTFKGRQNEQNAINFIEDQRNLRAHGYMTLETYDENGVHSVWNEDERKWEAPDDVEV